MNIEDLELNDSFRRWSRTFVCPDCGQEIDVNEAEVIKIQTASKHIGTEFHGRIIVRTYRNTYYNVRFCKSCAKTRKLTSRVLRVIMFIIIPLCFGVVLSVCEPDRGIGGFFGAILGAEFLCWLVYMIWKLITMGYSIDINHAARCNALAPGDSFSSKK